MTAPDLHPEELLDRAAAGTLSPAERERLEAHLAVCPACRFEQQARADFAALPAGVPKIDDLVTRALAGLPTAPPPRRARPPVGLVAAAVALVGFGSLAAFRLAPPLAAMLGLVQPAPATSEPPRQTGRGDGPRAPTPSRPLETDPAGLAPDETPGSTTPPRGEQPSSANAQPAPAPAKPRPAAPRATDARTTPSAVSPAEPGRDAEAPPPGQRAAVGSDADVTAASLFREATAARTAGNREEAERRYRELAERFPRSTEATVAHAVLGRLLLDLGRPEEGLRELEATLDGGPSALREDALAHRALALDALQDARARAAWEQLLREFPASIHARRARERLEALPPP
ncbi:MAG: zf-HC2 domain-containing protein [Myxococcaceae bacterium]|jgi:TolA-binding protein|nr:zf-HC2 domain-containing protein [Myxococcaceae bacterium]